MFKPGDRVRITLPGSILHNEIGVIVWAWPDAYKVKVSCYKAPWDWIYAHPTRLVLANECKRKNKA